MWLNSLTKHSRRSVGGHLAPLLHCTTICFPSLNGDPNVHDIHYQLNALMTQQKQKQLQLHEIDSNCTCTCPHQQQQQPRVTINKKWCWWRRVIILLFHYYYLYSISLLWELKPRNYDDDRVFPICQWSSYVIYEWFASQSLGKWRRVAPPIDHLWIWVFILFSSSLIDQEAIDLHNSTYIGLEELSVEFPVASSVEWSSERWRAYASRISLR